VSVLCLVERDGAGITDASLRAVGFGRLLAAAGGGELTAVLFAGADSGATEGGAAAAQLAAAGAAGVCVVTAGGLTDYAPVAWARALQQLAGSGPVSAVIAAATDRGSEVLAHLGALSGLPVAANCVSAAPDGQARGTWRLLRQRWAGSVLEEAVLDAPCALLTVAADALPADAAAGGAAAGPDGLAVTRFSPDLSEADRQLRATELPAETAGASLATARVVVGGGRGVGGPEGFAALEQLAGLLGGVVGVSRVVTSQGWRPHRQQVGQTGTKISPELYLACGISGAIQHMAGCQGARHLVVINTDPDAPIIGRAEYAVIGDLNEIVPALVEAIRSRTSG
jgi:electron transfer flavoprotein alpha subunit